MLLPAGLLAALPKSTLGLIVSGFEFGELLDQLVVLHFLAVPIGDMPRLFLIVVSAPASTSDFGVRFHGRRERF